MSQGPDAMPSDMERSRWSSVSPDLEGTVVTEEALRELFPADAQYAPLIARVVREGKYKVYERRYASGHRLMAPLVAYACNTCTSVVVGAPEIRDDVSIKLDIPLGGREGYDVYCKNCSALLDEVTFAQG